MKKLINAIGKNRSLTQLLFKMKLTFAFLLFGLITVSASTYSQSTKLNISVKNNNIIDIFREIEDISEFYFFFQKEDLERFDNVSVEKNNATIDEILNEVLDGTNMTYKVVDRYIVVKKVGENFDDFDFDSKQKGIEGKVDDDKGLPLPGVTVIIKGTTQGTVTDIDGHFNITQVAPDDVLVFSFVGMQSQEITVGNQTSLSITMQVDAIGIEEVVAVGYGTARRKDLSGAVQTKKLEDTPEANLPTSNLLQSMQGMAGVNVAAQNSPGTSPSIIIRGQNSIYGSNQPLIVLDGVIYLGSISDINPGDIAYIDVLKDASATAVYGSRAANGVVVITTKSGKSGKPVIRYKASAGFNTWAKKYPMMDTERFAEKYIAQYHITMDEIRFDDVTATEYFNAGINTDWQDLISRNGFQQDHQLSVSGKADRINYYFSGGYATQEGAIVGDDYERISLRTKMDVDVTDWLKVGIDGTYNNNDYSGVGANVFYSTYMPSWGYPYRYEGMPYNVGSAIGTGLERWPIGQSIPNPLWGTDGTIEDVDVTNFFRFLGYAVVDIPKIKGLTYRLNYSITSSFINQDRFAFEDYYIGEQGTGFYNRYSPSEIQKHLAEAHGHNNFTKRYNYVVDNILNYKREFGDHYIDATLVATRDYAYYKLNSIEGSDYSLAGNTSLGVDGLHKAAIQKVNTEVVEKANIGYLGRLSYAYKDKYHVTGSVRRDGASVFGKDQKWGYFPSLGMAWTVSQEDFFKDNGLFDYLKVKASYGKNGNQGVSPYQTLAKVISGSDGSIEYEFGDDPSTIIYGVAQENLASPNLGWETTTSFNGGFQSALLSNRIFLDLDFYFSKTTDQIFNRVIPIMTGYDAITSSLGQVNNNGFEVNLRTVNIDKQDFRWESNLTVWLNRNKIVSIYGDDLDGDGKEDDDIANSLFIGKPISSIYGYEYIGVVQEDDTEYINNAGAKPGDPMFKDLNGDGIISAEYDRKILGCSTPNFRMNLANTFTYRNLSLYVMFTGIFGGGKDNYYLGANPSHNSFRERFGINEPDHDWWTAENKSEKYLRPDYDGSRYLGLQSRGFVKLQDISLSYKFPNTTLNSIGVASLELFASAKNVYTFTNWYGNGDPELGLTPYSSSYPVPTTMTLGLNVSF